MLKMNDFPVFFSQPNCARTMLGCLHDVRCQDDRDPCWLRCSPCSPRHDEKSYQPAKDRDRYHEKGKLWLMLLCHASSCKDYQGMCKVSECDTAKAVCEHMRQCKEVACAYPGCATSRKLMSNTYSLV